ncbi:outer membrane protein assembly factor BamB family protein [Virgisporangium aurantiacum]|uniref:Pyrrolo-quinoline quinone repeat domain-containing protein n=1 Tax=Virgisporangium aurantiacum TaxID=175570 RepID=A0A8J4EA81_9ACTN|nr:PQQ-binding-like beta-propeller repeat protein [Virgisporangium aurantiacum]GIJ64497.1 hypothetical protein Vau01_120130 [Virgisporangium aurantiacum]
MGRVKSWVGSAVVAVLLLAGCTDDDGGPDPDRFDTGPHRDPAWSVRMPDGFGRPARAQVAGDAVVVEADNGVVVLARSDGAARWQRKESTGSAVRQVRVAGTTLVVDEGDRVRLVDLATGAERPELRGSGLPNSVAVTTTGVYLVESIVDTSGTRLVAYDLAGTARWKREFASHVRLAGSATGDDADPLAAAPPGPVVAGVRQASGMWVNWSLSADTGADLVRLPGDQEFRERGESRIGDTLLTWNEQSSDCALPVTAIDTGTAATRWQGPVGQWTLWRTDKDAWCGGAWRPLVVGGRSLLASTPAEEGQVRDVVSGAVRWTGPPGTYPMTLAGDTLLARAGHGLGALVAVDLAGGAERWRRTLPPANDLAPNELNLRHAGLADAFVLPVADAADAENAPATRVVVFDARTGDPRWSTAGVGFLLGAGGAGVVTAFYEGLSPTDPGPVEIRYTPL